jgi:hypothetical protein
VYVRAHSSKLVGVIKAMNIPVFSSDLTDHNVLPEEEESV